MIYELINPSDPYTFEAESREAAAAAAMLLSPVFGAREVETDWTAGPFLLATAEQVADWWLGEFGSEIFAWMKSHRAAIAAALETFVIGGDADRHDYEDAMEAIDDPQKREAFRRARQDRRRGSLSRIGEAAWQLAERLRAESQSPTPNPQSTP